MFVPLRPPIRVARPRDWTQTAAWAVLLGLGAMLLVIVLLVRLPEAWVRLAQGHAWAVRIALMAASLWILRWLGDLGLAQLPRATFLLGGTIVFPEQLRRRRIKLEDVDEIVVELRPPPVHEAFVAVMDDGTTHELCATHQPGAAALYAVAARRIARSKRRAQRRRDREQRRAQRRSQTQTRSQATQPAPPRT